MKTSADTELVTAIIVVSNGMTGHKMAILEVQNIARFLLRYIRKRAKLLPKWHMS